MAAPQQLGVSQASGGFANSFLGSIAGSAVNTLAGGLLGEFFADAANERSKDMQKWQWDNFLSPKAQARALGDAGINPAVAFGQGAISHTLQPNAQSVPVSPVDVGLSGQDLAASVLALAQAKKVGAEEEGQILENKLLSDTYEEKVREIGLANKWTEEQTAKVTQEIGLMVGQFNNLQKQTEKLESEKKLTDKEVSWFDRHMSAEVEYIKSTSDYNKALKDLTDSQKKLLDDTMDDLKKITNLNRQQLEKIVGLLDKYGDAQAIVGMLSQVVGSASDLIGSIANFKNVGKVVETITGSTTQKSDGSWSTTNTRTTRK